MFNTPKWTFSLILILLWSDQLKINYSVKNGFEAKGTKKAPEKMQFINEEKKVEDLEVAEKVQPSKDGSETAEMKICFKNLQAFSACFDAFAHGGNDVG